MSLLCKTRKEFFVLVVVVIFISVVAHPRIGSSLGAKIPDVVSPVLTVPTSIFISMFNWQGCAKTLVPCLDDNYLFLISLVSTLALILAFLSWIIYLFIREETFATIARVSACSFLLSIILAISFGTGYELTRYLAIIFILVLYYQRKWGYLARF